MGEHHVHAYLELVEWLPINQNIICWAVVVAQLVKRSLPIPEVRGSNPVIGKIYLFPLNICLLSTVYWKDENKEKEAGDGLFFFLKKISFVIPKWLLKQLALS